MKEGKYTRKLAYIGAGCGLVLFAIFGLLPGSFLGGVMGLNAYKDIVGVESFDHAIIKMCEHVIYIINLVGEAHVGYGLDLCDSYEEAQPRTEFALERYDCIRNHTELIDVTAELLREGVSEEVVKKIIGQNFVDYFMNIF